MPRSDIGGGGFWCQFFFTEGCSVGRVDRHRSGETGCFFGGAAVIVGMTDPFLSLSVVEDEGPETGKCEIDPCSVRPRRPRIPCSFSNNRRLFRLWRYRGFRWLSSRDWPFVIFSDDDRQRCLYTNKPTAPSTPVSLPDARAKTARPGGTTDRTRIRA
jgi:hypothetical protein